MKSIIVDDELSLMEHFQIQCQDLPNVNLAGSFATTEAALDYASQHPVDLAFLDMDMPESGGIQLAVQLRKLHPDVIIIFLATDERYMPQAIRQHIVDYFIMKPYSFDDLKVAVDHAKLLSVRLTKSVSIKTFGSFDVFLNGQPIAFVDDKAKELMALLVNNRGSVLSVKVARALLYPDLSLEDATVQITQCYERLMQSLENHNLGNIIERNTQGAFLRREAVDCDLYNYLFDDKKKNSLFNDEYLIDYSWSTPTRENLIQMSKISRRDKLLPMNNTLCPNIHFIVDEDLTITYINDSFLDALGYSLSQVAEDFHFSLKELTFPDDYEYVATSVATKLETGEKAVIEFRLIKPGGENLWMRGNFELIFSEAINGFCEVDCILIDISDLKTENKLLEQAAAHDNLTGLLNRAEAQKRIKQLLSTQSPGVLIVMDIDNFKLVNDTYGHPFADMVLTDIAAVLSQSFRSDDILCRLGGDEFLIFMKNTVSINDIRQKMDSVIDCLSTVLKAKTTAQELSCSFGAAIFPSDAASFESLYQMADIALYAAKEEKGCLIWYSDLEGIGFPQNFRREITKIDS